MPIYFGHAADKKKQPSSNLRAQNINLLRAAPSTFKINFIPDIIHFSFQIAIRALTSIFLSFSLKQACPADIHRSLPQLTNLVPFSLPPLAFQVADNNPAVVDTYIKDDYYQQNIRNRTLLLKDHPSQEDVTAAIKNPSAIRDCFVPWKYVNLNAMLAFFVLRKIATMIAQNTLPPVYHDTKTSTGKKRAAATQEPDSSSTDIDMTDPLDVSTKNACWSYKRLKHSGSLEDTVTIKVNAEHDPHFTHVYPTLNNIVTRITHGGVFLPYVPDLCRQDTTGPIPFITTHLYKLLGDSPNQCRENLEFIRSGWGLLSKTDVGNQLAHFFKCYELSLEGQASFTPIFTFSYYEGAVIQGDCFEIIVPGNSARPKSKDHLIAELKNTDSHARSILKITELLNKSRTNSALLIADSLTSMGKIRKYVLQEALTHEQIEEIRALCYRLRFSDEWAVNPKTLLDFLNIIRTGELPEDAPVSPSAIDEHDIGKAALSCFGRMCPSFIIPSGRSLDLRKPIPPPKMETIAAKGRKRTREVLTEEFEQTVQVRLCSWKVACNDLDRVRTAGEITVVVGATARAGNIRVFRGQMRYDLWGALTGVVHDSQPSKQGTDMVQDIDTSKFGGAQTHRKDEIAETTLFM